MQNKNLVIVISAPSGAGKTTIINKFLTSEKKCEFVISKTTRKPRRNEIDGSDYYFTSKRDFEKLIENDEFIEWALVHNNYYGVEKKEFDRILALEKIPLFDVDVQGAKQIKRKLKNAVLIFITPPSLEGLKKRLVKRGTDSAEDIALRMQNAENELKEIDKYEYLVVNNKIRDSLSDLKAILRAELCKKKIKEIKF